MRRPESILTTGLLAAALIAGCSTAPSTSGTTATSAPVSSTSSSSAATPGSLSSTPATSVSSAATPAATPVQIVSASVGANDATITVHDSGSQALSLSGWTLMVGTTPVQLPSNTTVAAGKSLTLHAASGTSSDTDVYLGQNAQQIQSSLQPGTRVALQDPDGSTVTSFNVPAG
jgi:competence protein ComEC